MFGVSPRVISPFSNGAAMIILVDHPGVETPPPRYSYCFVLRPGLLKFPPWRKSPPVFFGPRHLGSTHRRLRYGMFFAVVICLGSSVLTEELPHHENFAKSSNSKVEGAATAGEPNENDRFFLLWFLVGPGLTHGELLDFFCLRYFG